MNEKQREKSFGFICDENSNGIIGEPDPVRPDRHFGNVA
jgi:hypothetical protein